MNEWQAKLRNAARNARQNPVRPSPTLAVLLATFDAMKFEGDAGSEAAALSDFERQCRALSYDRAPESFKSPLIDEIEAMCRSSDPVIRKEGFARSDALVGPRFRAALARGR